MITISSSSMNSGKGKHPLEVDEQKAVWKRLGQIHVGQHTLQDYSYMVPNGTQLGGGRQRRAQYMASLKAQGFRPGVSDLVVAYPNGVYHGAYIELKRVPEAYKGPAALKGAVRPEQAEWLRLMLEAGYWCAVAYGAEDFNRLMRLYLDGKSPPALDSHPPR